MKMIHSTTGSPMISENFVAFQGECQLAGWSESHTGGAKVTLWLADHSQLDAFRALTARKGNVAGHRFMVAMVEIGEDEQPVDQTKATPEAPAPKGGALSRLAGLWCQTPEFQDWLRVSYPAEWEAIEEGIDGPESHEIAAEIVRQLCAIKSRAELDHSPEAARFFEEFVRGPYRKVLAFRGVQE